MGARESRPGNTPVNITLSLRGLLTAIILLLAVGVYQILVRQIWRTPLGLSARLFLSFTGAGVSMVLVYVAAVLLHATEGTDLLTLSRVAALILLANIAGGLLAYPFLRAWARLRARGLPSDPATWRSRTEIGMPPNNSLEPTRTAGENRD